MLRRAHQHLQDHLSSSSSKQQQQQQQQDDDESRKVHPAPLQQRRRTKLRQITKRFLREHVEDWLLLVTCSMVLLVCILWFVGKAVMIINWVILPMLDSMVLQATSSYNSGGGHRHGSSTGSNLLKEMPLNPVYTIPHAHKAVGDRSYEYAILRQEIDALFPEDTARSLQRARDLQLHRDYGVMPTIPLDHNSDQLPQPVYDIYSCPSTPPEGYPFQWNLLSIIDNWNPENTTVPNSIFNGLCVFDYNTEYEKAMTYRNAEVPFVVVNDPRIAATAERWNTPGYMERMLGHVRHRTTRSDTNHFLYAIPPRANKMHLRKQHSKHGAHTAPPGWKEPTQALRMTYTEWLQKANVSDDRCTPDQPHWYYRLIGCGLTGPDGSCDQGSSEYLYDEMPYFQPSPGDLYLRQAEQQKGIHCRFGQKGIVADNHFDAGRNTIVVLSGSRRYMLASPDQCLNMALFDKNHPSARHSEVNWSNPDLERFPNFAKAVGNEVILQAGEALYLPNNWFHHIISLTLNMQCNTRSGKGPEYMQEIHDCGFDEI